MAVKRSKKKKNEEKNINDEVENSKSDYSKKENKENNLELTKEKKVLDRDKSKKRISKKNHKQEENTETLKEVDIQKELVSSNNNLNDKDQELDNQKLEVTEEKIDLNKEEVISDILKQEELDKKDEDINIQDSEEVITNNSFRKRGFKKFFYLVGILIVILFLGYLIFPRIKIEGNREQVIKYYEEYVESGYGARFLWKDISDKVKISSDLINGKVGNYKITYYLKYGFLRFEEDRYVNVVDDLEPVINISSDILKVCPNQELPELEYSVLDEYDGDITSNMIEKQEDDKIILSVSDSSNNISTKIINIDRTDSEKPKITLNGNSTIYLVVGEKYVEYGYSAFDNCDGEISGKVSVSGNVGNSIGNYNIIYSVTDSSGNRSEVKREVLVISKNISNNGTVHDGSIYLTFDDGPNYGTTNVILDVLKDEGVKATFFVTSRGPDNLIKRMYDEGHTVALHTDTHEYSYVYSSIDNYFNDLNRVSDRVERITGEKSMIIRFPGGSSNTISRNYKIGIMSDLSKLVLSKGYRYYDWNIDSMDASSARSSQDVYNNVISYLSKSRVNMVLMHDTKTITRDALKNIIRYGKSKGYSFKQIDMSTYMVKHGINN